MSIVVRMQSELEYLYGLERLGIKPGLAVMEKLMEALDHPEKKFKSIHVTGTNGKGSTCAMLESILRVSGLKTAMYTSPHLFAFNERIQIAGVPIVDEDLLALMREIRAIVEQRHIHPTFFEFTTALAFLYFARSNIDIAVIEVGMGGLLDATNVITPILSIITNVGLDHMEFLGDTTRLIAQEKAGIIKEGAPILTREEDPELVRLFEEVAREKKTQLIRVQDSVKTKVLHADLNGQEVEITTPSKSPSYEGEKTMTITLPLLGSHQIKNLETVLASIPLLTKEGVGEVSRENIITGIMSVKWEGRLQVVSQKPLILVDGAHNVDGAHALADFLKTVPMCDVLVFAAKKGKNITEVLSSILPRCKRVIITKGSYMPEDPENIAAVVRNAGHHVEVRDNVSDAVRLGLSYAGDSGVMLITGSLYMIPDALALLKESKV